MTILDTDFISCAVQLPTIGDTILYKVVETQGTIYVTGDVITQNGYMYVSGEVQGLPFIYLIENTGFWVSLVEETTIEESSTEETTNGEEEMGLIGLDILFLGHKLWPLQMTINQIPAGYALGFFDYVKNSPIGDPIPNFKKLLAAKDKDGKRKYPAYRVQMQYDESHKLIDVSRLKERLPLYEKIAKENTDVKIYISHTCEYKSNSVAEINKRVALIKSLAPSCIPVNSVWQGATPGSTLKETHILDGKKGKNWIVSTDGVAAPQIDMEAFHNNYKNTVIRFLWTSRFNFRDAQTPLPKPANRTVTPTKELFQSMIRLAEGITTKAPTPTFRGRIIPIKDPLLWKSQCEDFHGADNRKLKPMLACASSAQLLSIVTYTGREVCKIKKYGNLGSMKRYYTGLVNSLWGYEIGEKAERMSGSEWVWVKDGNTYLGPINPAFRKGYFRGSERD